MFAVTAVQTSGGNFGYVRGFKTENIVDYTSAEDGFSWKEREAYSSIERMKSILRFVSSLMRTVY
jgi:hypothetical protein